MGGPPPNVSRNAPHFRPRLLRRIPINLKPDIMQGGGFVFAAKEIIEISTVVPHGRLFETN